MKAGDQKVNHLINHLTSSIISTPVSDWADAGLAPQQPAGMYTNSEFIGSMPAIELDDGDNSLSEDSHPGAMHASHGVADISKVTPPPPPPPPDTPSQSQLTPFPRRTGMVY